MLKQDKVTAIAELKEKFENNQFFYVTDSSELTVEKINDFRRKCYENNIEVKVVKNTLAIKALEQVESLEGTDELYKYFKGPSTLLFSDVANKPAKILKEFRATAKKPVLKVAYIDSSIYAGDDQIDVLKSLKSKEELIGDVILLLQSPIKNVIGSLQSGQNTLGGLLKALEERAES